MFELDIVVDDIFDMGFFVDCCDIVIGDLVGYWFSLKCFC